VAVTRKIAARPEAPPRLGDDLPQSGGEAQASAKARYKRHWLICWPAVAAVSPRRFTWSRTSFKKNHPTRSSHGWPAQSVSRRTVPGHETGGRHIHRQDRSPAPSGPRLTAATHKMALQGGRRHARRTGSRCKEASAIRPQLASDESSDTLGSIRRRSAGPFEEVAGARRRGSGHGFQSADNQALVRSGPK